MLKPKMMEMSVAHTGLKSEDKNVTALDINLT